MEEEEEPSRQHKKTKKDKKEKKKEKKEKKKEEKRLRKQTREMMKQEGQDGRDEENGSQGDTVSEDADTARSSPPSPPEAPAPPESGAKASLNAAALAALNRANTADLEEQKGEGGAPTGHDGPSELKEKLKTVRHNHLNAFARSMKRLVPSSYMFMLKHCKHSHATYHRNILQCSTPHILIACWVKDTPVEIKQLARTIRAGQILFVVTLGFSMCCLDRSGVIPIMCSTFFNSIVLRSKFTYKHLLSICCARS